MQGKEIAKSEFNPCTEGFESWNYIFRIRSLEEGRQDEMKTCIDMLNVKIG